MLEQSECHSWQGSLERPGEAAKLAMGAVYRLIKEDPTLDIAAELQKVQDEYNAAN